MDFADVQRMASTLPDTEPGTSYGTPAVKTRGKLLARLKEDGATMVLCAILPDERALLMEMVPDVFHVTDHYRAYPAMLVHLARADPAQVKDLLVQSWRRLASRKALQQYEERQGAARASAGARPSTPPTARKQ